MKNLSAIVLAAGSGSRIGTPKLKLKIDDDYFVNVIIRKLSAAGIKNISVVIKEDYKEWCLGNVHGALFIINDEPETGMFHSVKLGILNSGNSDGVIIFPVDHPFVKADTINKIINSFQSNHKCVIKPLYQNKSGHPVIIPCNLFNSILNSSSGDNLNNIIRRSELSVIDISVDDIGILKNINNAEDLEK